MPPSAAAQVVVERSSICLSDGRSYVHLSPCVYRLHSSVVVFAAFDSYKCKFSASCFAYLHFKYVDEEEEPHRVLSVTIEMCNKLFR